MLGTGITPADKGAVVKPVPLMVTNAPGVIWLVKTGTVLDGGYGDGCGLPEADSGRKVQRKRLPVTSCE